MIGPVITFFGVASANGAVPTPIGFAQDGTAIYRRTVSQGFFIVVEARPGMSGRPVGTTTFNADLRLPDLQIVSSRNLGNGSTDVCDNVPGFLGGVPALDPPSFTDSNGPVINDFSCRFDVRSTSGDACTIDATSAFSFVNPQTTRQFCTVPAVGAEIAFPLGDTRLTVRVRDTFGFPGLPASIIVRVQ
jgi:hypothetical protein